MLGNVSKMAVCFKINVERCSENAGSEFKDDPTGAAAVIQTRIEPTNPEQKKPESGASKVSIIIWKADYTDFKQKERIWAQTNPRISNIVLGQCTQEIELKLKGRDGWPMILRD